MYEKLARALQRTVVSFSVHSGNLFRRYRRKHQRTARTSEILDELQFYIAAHELAGVEFDTESQRIAFDSGLIFTLRKEGGVWWITAFERIGDVICYVARTVWKRIMNGAKALSTRTFAGWRIVKAKPLSCAI